MCYSKEQLGKHKHLKASEMLCMPHKSKTKNKNMRNPKQIFVRINFWITYVSNSILAVIQKFLLFNPYTESYHAFKNIAFIKVYYLGHLP